MADKTSTSYQDPLIRPDVNLQFLSGLVLVALPLVLLFLVLAKEPSSQPAKQIFKPVTAASPAHP
ncbi:MAG TPA: hypothetical protein V6C99_07105 [Oculatellaceae cyanobacterium]|jgi:hypothetical protein